MAHDLAGGLLTPVSEPRTGNESKLCRACAKLGLRANDFIVTRIPDSGDEYDLPGSGRRLRGSSQRLANKRQILDNNNICQLCTLIVRSLELGQTNNDLRDDAELYVRFEIDGRRQDGRDEAERSNQDATSLPFRRLTRRLRLVWGTPRPDDVYLLLVAPDTYHRANHDLAGNWDTKALFLARRIDTTKSNEVLMRSWLRACKQQHGSKCQSTREEKRKMFRVAESSWFAVIDVFDMCLKSLPTHKATPGYQTFAHEPYAILSYVWGSTSNYTTKKSNVLFHQSPGGLEDRWEKLPETVRNAIRLTKTIGIRYLWVDRLCIIQDSPRSCRLNIHEMDTIYSNARFTICAADGADSTAGLKALQPEYRQQTNQIIQQCGPVNLMATQLAESVIKNSVWNTRAWTFQERMLSKRSLVFCRGRVYFQCRQSTMSEDIVAEPQGGGWSLELAQAPHQILHHLYKRPIVMYMDCVQRYSKRQLSNSQDILSAFKGIGNILERAMNAPMVHGLPTSHFDLALLWHPTKIAKRRLVGGEPNNTVAPFPSWAWCGWQLLDVGQNKDAAIEYSGTMLEGCFDSTREFLNSPSRTWIQYYIRDDQGELRLIWGPSSQSSPTVVEERWQGYEAGLQRFWGPVTGHDQIEHRDQNTLLTTGHRAQPQAQFRPMPQELTYPLETVHRQDTRTEGRNVGDIPFRDDGQDIVEVEQSLSPDLDDGEGFGSVGEFVPDNQPSDDAERATHYLAPYEEGARFQKVYADSPYRVREAPSDRVPTSETPDQGILQFFTWTAHLYLDPLQRSQDMSDLQRCDILDLAGDWCGSILLDPDCQLLRDHKDMHDFGDPRKYEFIALSEAKAFTEDECRTWTYYSPNNQNQSEWELYHCLLVEEDDQQHVMHRVGLGKVFKSVFRSSKDRNWKEIILG